MLTSQRNISTDMGPDDERGKQDGGDASKGKARGDADVDFSDAEVTNARP